MLEADIAGLALLPPSYKSSPASLLFLGKASACLRVYTPKELAIGCTRRADGLLGGGVVGPFSLLLPYISHTPIRTGESNKKAGGEGS